MSTTGDVGADGESAAVDELRQHLATEHDTAATDHDPVELAAIHDEYHRNAAKVPELHCFREDHCAEHGGHVGPNCCCCGYPANEHLGCDCDP